MKRFIVLPLCLCFAPVLALGAESPTTHDRSWPQWRGPKCTGVAPHADPPVEWSEDKNVKWKVEIPGRGHASPVVWGDRIFVLTAVDSGKAGEPGKKEEASPRRGWRMPSLEPKSIHKFKILAIARKDGRVLWTRTLCEEQPHERTHSDGSWASGSPITDGKYVYAFFGSRGIYCLDMEGILEWEEDLGRMKTRMGFGEGSSPALFGDTIVVNWDHEGQSYIVAFDKKNGEERWRVRRDEVTSWATPLIVEAAGKVQVITSATKRVRSYDLATGDLIWECRGLTYNVIPAPVHADGIVYVASGFRASALMAIRLSDAGGDITGTKAVVWSLNKHTPYTPSMLLYGGNLYMLKTNNAVLSCFDAKTGKEYYTRRKMERVGTVYASPVGAAGRVYIVGKRGTTVVVKHGPTFEVLARNVLDDKFTASPALVGKEIILRGHKALYCILGD